MEEMLEKGKAEKADEQAQFAAYKTFCDSTTVEKTKAIADAEESIGVLKADIEKYTATAAKMTKEIAGHDQDISTWKRDQKAATKVRKLEKADYDAMHADYTESIDALERAITVLKSQAHDRKQASLAQVSALQQLSLIPDSTKHTLDSFVQEERAWGLDVTPPEAHGYEFQSNGVIEMLEKLLDKFRGEIGDLEQKEMNTKHSYNMLMQDLKSQTERANQDREEKTEAKAKNLQAKADAKGDLEDTTKTRAADKTYLQDLTATCEQKSTDFEARQQLRAEELEAINKAIEIISSSSVKGSSETHLSLLAQAQSSDSGPAVLAMLRSDMNVQSQARVAEYLSKMGQQLDSRVLLQIAAHVADDPMVKVKKMIKDLIVRLMEEANEEAEHKGWCDTEMATNEQTRKEKTEGVETLKADIDGLEASMAKLTEDITELTKAVAKLDQAMSKATELRQKEKAKNVQTVKDAQVAQKAVARALAVLKDFYAKAGAATALLEQQPEAPEVFDKPYTGMQGAKGGVVGMLDVIMTDFKRLEADTASGEVKAQKEYDTFMTDSKVDKDSKTADVEHKTAKKQDKSRTLTSKKEDLVATQKELDAALAYFDKLKPSCVDSGVSFEDRVRRRREEIASLQESLKILNGDDM